jgi:predicted transposase YbfD/YdcC
VGERLPLAVSDRIHKKVLRTRHRHGGGTLPSKERSNLVETLATVPDPRRQCKNLRQAWGDVLTIGFGGALCGGDDFVAIEEFGRSKETFLRRFLELTNGIPSHDTIRRVFQAVCPQALQPCWIAWLKNVRQRADPPAHDQVVAIDGKTLRRTGDRARGVGAGHRVRAWATANGLTLGQLAVDAQSKESTAIPQWIELLERKDGVVTIDAAGCQKAMAARIVATDADDVLAVNENQPTLYEPIAEPFAEELDKEKADSKLRCHRQVEAGHGRTETRPTFVVPAPKGLVPSGIWAGLATLVLVLRARLDHATGNQTEELRSFLSSLPARAKRLASAVRQHWGMENSLHGVLEVAFQEDRMRQRDRKAIDNLALLKRLAVSLLRQDQTVKAGVQCQRTRAGWEEDYLLHLLFDSE